MNASFHHFSQDDIAQLDRNFRRNFINTLSGFKSLSLCGTINTEGQHNLALMSNIIHIGANPPLLGLLFRPHTVPRHSLENLLATGFFTLNHVRESYLEAAHQASAKYDSEVSEFEAVGLTPQTGTLHPAPYVAEAPVQIGLAYEERHDIAANETILIVGRIVEVQVEQTALQADGYLDLDQTGTLTVAGLDAYFKPAPLGRKPYARP
ncbi:MAG: flavin reductase [Bacteroidota bacterium]